MAGRRDWPGAVEGRLVVVVRQSFHGHRVAVLPRIVRHVALPVRVLEQGEVTAPRHPDLCTCRGVTHQGKRTERVGSLEHEVLGVRVGGQRRRRLQAVVADPAAPAAERSSLSR